MNRCALRWRSLASLFAITLSVCATGQANARIDCVGLIKPDRHQPTQGALSYSLLGNPKNGDERCEGRIIELQAQSAGFVIDAFTGESSLAAVRAGGTIKAGGQGIPAGVQGQITLLGIGLGSIYRLDAFVASGTTLTWPVETVARKLAVDFAKLRIVGRIVGTGPEMTFFPVDLASTTGPKPAEAKLFVRARFTRASTKVVAFLGGYDETGHCAVGESLQRWANVDRHTPLTFGIPAGAPAKFCIVFEYDVLGIDDVARQDRATYHFVK